MHSVATLQLYGLPYDYASSVSLEPPIVCPVCSTAFCDPLRFESVLQNMIILVPSSTLGIWGLVNWGFGALGIWDNGLLGELGLRELGDRVKRGIEARGIDRTGAVLLQAQA